MKKHKHAINNIRQTIKALTEHKRQVKAEIQALKFDAEGKRRPETGPERDRLWLDYTWSRRPLARAAHLALGMLRGTPYKEMESRCAENSPPPLYGMLKAVHEALGDDEALKAEWTLGRIQNFVEGKEPTAQEVAA